MAPTRPHCWSFWGCATAESPTGGSRATRGGAFSAGRPCSGVGSATSGHDYPVAPEAIWGEKWFATWHDRAPYTLYTFVSFDHQQFAVGFSLETAKDIVIEGDFGRFSCQDKGEYGGWLVASRDHARVTGLRFTLPGESATIYPGASRIGAST
jgi:hypothetical protein